MLYPVFLDVREKKCVVVGGGEVAARKVEALRNAGGCVTLISPDLCEELRGLAASGAIDYHAAPYNSGVLDGAFVVVASTDIMEVNRAVRADCAARNILINVVDVPELCDFHVPAIVRSGDITVAIGTGGGSPALARRLRLHLQKHIGPEFGELLAIMGGWRDAVKESITGQERRKDLWERIIDSPALEQLRAGRRAAAEQTVKSIVEQEMGQP